MGDYIIPAGYGEAEHVDKKSRFIGQVQHVESESEAMAFVESVRRRRDDATHNVWAYVLANGALRWSDDGEPGGTSGQPTLNVFRQAGVCDVCCVVTRYFGGVLLGSGGLVRAYSRPRPSRWRRRGWPAWPSGGGCACSAPTRSMSGCAGCWETSARRTRRPPSRRTWR